MLVLSRQRDEAICIGNDIQITVVDIRGDKVRLGITAPREVAVDRLEVRRSKRREAVAGLGEGAHALMSLAVREAQSGLAEGGWPIGAVLVRGGQEIAAGRDRRTQNGDPLGTADVECLRAAGVQKTYADTVLYMTSMPGPIGAAAVVQLGIARVVIGDTVNFPGAAEQLRAHGVEVVDVHDADAIGMLTRFSADHGAILRDLAY